MYTSVYPCLFASKIVMYISEFFSKMILHTWMLPKGDLYEVWKSNGHLMYYSRVQRETETTLCCHGTNSMTTIRQYYMDIKASQEDAMNDTTNAKLHAYWIAYKSRRLSSQSPQSSNSHAYGSQTCSSSWTSQESNVMPQSSLKLSKKRNATEQSGAKEKKVSFLL